MDESFLGGFVEGTDSWPWILITLGNFQCNLVPAHFLNSCGVQILARNQPHYCGGTNFTHYLPNSSGQSFLSHNMLLSFIGQQGKMSPVYKLINDISIQRTCQYYFNIKRSLWDCYALIWSCGPGKFFPSSASASTRDWRPELLRLRAVVYHFIKVYNVFI